MISVSRILSILLAAVISFPVAAFATAPAQQAIIAPAPTKHRELALRLAMALNPEQGTLASADRMLSTGLPAQLKAVPEYQVYEEHYPGITAAVIAAIKPVLLEQSRSQFPSMWGKLADLFEERLTLADMTQALSFYEGPVGIRVVGSMLGTMTGEAAIKENLANPLGGTSVKSIESDSRQAALTTMIRLTAADRRAVTLFGISPAGRKVTALGGDINQVIAQWGQENTPAVRDKVANVTQKTIADFIDAAEARKIETPQEKKGH